MRTLAAIVLVAVVGYIPPVSAQPPQAITMTLSVSRTGPTTWVATGTVSGISPLLATRAFVGGPGGKEIWKGELWMGVYQGGFVRQDGTFSIPFDAPHGGFTLLGRVDPPAGYVNRLGTPPSVFVP